MKENFNHADYVLKVLVSTFMTKAKKDMPFGRDYTWITWAVHAFDHGDPNNIGWKNIKSLFEDDSLSPFKKKFRRWLVDDVGKATCNPENLESNKQAIIDAFKKIIEEKIRVYMPEANNWFKGNSGSDIKFPKSSTGIILGKDQQPILSANCYGNITCSVGPSKNSGTTEEQFFDGLFVKRPKIIIAIGKFYTLQNPDFNPYISGGTFGKYEAKSSTQIKNYKTLFITNNATKETLRIRVYNLVTADETPFYLTYETSLELLSLINDINPEASTDGLWIHCASGVGRTAQMRMIIELLQKFNSEFELRNFVDKFIFDEKITLTDCQIREEDYSKNAELTRNTLCLLRKIRYAIQQETQLDAAIQLAVLLRAAQLGASQEHYQRLATAMGIELDDLKSWNRLVGEECPLEKPDEGAVFYPIQCHDLNAFEKIDQSLHTASEALKLSLDALEESPAKKELFEIYNDQFSPAISKLQSLLKPSKKPPQLSLEHKSQSSASLFESVKNFSKKANRFSMQFSQGFKGAEPPQDPNTEKNKDPASILYNANIYFFDLFNACEQLQAKLSHKEIRIIHEKLLIPLRDQFNQAHQKPKTRSQVNPNLNSSFLFASKNTSEEKPVTLKQFENLKPSRRSLLPNPIESQVPTTFGSHRNKF